MKILLYICGALLIGIGIFAILAVRAGAEAEKTMKDIFDDETAKRN